MLSLKSSREATSILAKDTTACRWPPLNRVLQDVAFELRGGLNAVILDLHSEA
jgi:hypothetical protein